MNGNDALYRRALNLARQASDAFGDVPELVRSYVYSKLGRDGVLSDTIVNKAIARGSFTINYHVNASPEDLRNAMEFLSSLNRTDKTRLH